MSILNQQDDGQLIPYNLYTAGHSVNRDELRNAADRYENVKSVLNGEVQKTPGLYDSFSKYLKLLRNAPKTDSFANIGNSGIPVTVPGQPPQYGGPLVRRQKLQEAIENSNANNPWLGGIYGSRRPDAGLVDENPQAPVKSAGKPRKVRKGRSSGNSSRSGSNTYATADIPKGGVVSPATMMRTSGVQPVQAVYGNNASMGEGFDYTLTYDPMSNSMRPNDSYSYYDPSRNAPSGGDGTDLTLTYDPMTGQMVRR